MVAILTRLVGPTNTRGARIIVTSGAGHRLTVPWDYSLGTTENHEAAARKLADSLSWSGDGYGRLISGYLPTGYVHVFTGLEVR